MKTYRVTVEVSESAYLKLTHEQQIKTKTDGRGKKYPRWRIIDALLQGLPDPKPARPGKDEQEIAHARR